MKLRLFNAAASSPSYRVRIALALKQVDYQYVPVDFKARGHKSPDYVKLNPQGLLPTLEVDGIALTQSAAIIEWLEETFPTPSLYPHDSLQRARVRAIASIIATDIAPLHSMRVSLAIRNEFAQGDEGLRKWVHRFMSEGLGAIEKIMTDLPGPYACGDTPTLADLYLVPSMAISKSVGIDFAQLPRIDAAVAHAMQHPAFADTHPSKQKDA